MLTTSQLPEPFHGNLDQNEQILWMGKPKWLVFILAGVPFLILGCLWFAMDFSFIRSIKDGPGSHSGFVIPFFFLHLMPFWLSILNLFRLKLAHGNTFYAFTNKKLLIRSGFWGTEFKVVEYDRIQDLTVAVNPLENLMGVGTIKIFTGLQSCNSHPTLNRFTAIYGSFANFDRFTAIEQPYEVYRQLKQVSVKVRTDMP